MQGAKLNHSKEKAKLTNRQIAELTGISESTVSRILAGQVEPKFTDMAKIAKVTGASLDEIAEIEKKESEEIRELRAIVGAKDAQIATCEKVIGSYDRILEEKEKAAAYLKRIIKCLAIALAAVIVFLLAIVAYDIMNGDIGWARYAEALNPDSAQTVLAAIADWFRT